MSRFRDTAPTWDSQAAYKQLLDLANLSGRPHNKGSVREIVKEKPGSVPAVDVSCIILDELSRTFSDFCNFIPEVELLKQGELLRGYRSVLAKCDGLTAVDPVTAWVKAQAKACVSKLDIPGIDREKAAAEMWWADERQCRRTNQKLVAIRNRFEKGDKPLKWGYELARMAKFCRFVLGDAPDLPAILSRARYGPGASVGVSGDSTHYASKLMSWDCNEAAVDLAVDSLALDKGAWEAIGFDARESTNPDAVAGFKREARRVVIDSVVNHDKLLFVFKNAKALRSIGAQPTLSGMLQLGIDAEVKDLLTSVGVELDNQELNQKLAFEGSRDWRQTNPWCTLDKSSASNLVAKLLPGLIFPREWSKLLWKVRTPNYLAPDFMGGGIHAYEMYAGMGNGTTFSVESLIFAAIAFAVSEVEEPAMCGKSRVFAVYGDDVILRRNAVDKYIQLAEYLGFRMNIEKSFYEGPFRESCGADYWDGVNIRPAYVNGETDLNELELVGVHNTIMDSPICCLLGACKRIRGLWKKSFPWPLPSDPQGGLGFRTTGSVAWEYVLKAGEPVVSPVWFRPRGYVLDVKSKADPQIGSTSYISLMIALHKASQTRSYEQVLSLPFRRAIKIRVIPEQDLLRKDLLTMLRNQLTRLSSHKSASWWNPSRGR